MINLVPFAASFLVAILRTFFFHVPFVESYLGATIVVQISLVSLLAAYRHIFLSEKTASYIGWVSNGFQKEVGFSNLAIGVLGVLCIWLNHGFWLAAIIALSVFYIGFGFVHIEDIKKSQNNSRGNGWWHTITNCFLLPILIVVLLVAH